MKGVPFGRLFPAALAAAMTACSGGGGGGSFAGINCAGLAGATAESTVTCAGGCGGDYSEAAVDRDLDTYAIQELSPGASGSLAIRATAAAGTTYEGGTPAAVVYGIVRTSGNSLNTTEIIRTYLDNVLQETGPANAANGTTSGDEDVGRRAITTTLPFDAIEFVYTQTGGTAGVELRTHEFCTSTN